MEAKAGWIGTGGKKKMVGREYRNEKMNEKDGSVEKYKKDWTRLHFDMI